MSDLIAPHLEFIEARGYSPNTVQDRGTLLRRLHRDLPFGIEETSIDELAHWIAQFSTNQTKATYHAHITGFYTWAYEAGHLNVNPAAALPRPRVQPGVPNPPEREEFDDVFDRAEDPFRTWLLLAAFAGLRPIEISRLQRADVTERTITIRHGKGGKNEIVPTHEEIWRIVKDLPSGPIARNHYGRPVTATFISSRTGKYLRERLGIHGVGCRRMRHWFGTTALQETPNLRVVQELMRHSSPATTAVYTKITSEERRMAIAALPALTPASSYEHRA